MKLNGIHLDQAKQTIHVIYPYPNAFAAFALLNAELVHGRRYPR
ncbi:hypothetical protein X750_30740 [Mesorhizobium sp. LNJC394B00]|nr:hypothetical protein X750_30740 [Mesorhizobium sp. LNJC394B00]